MASPIVKSDTSCHLSGARRRAFTLIAMVNQHAVDNKSERTGTTVPKLPTTAPLTVRGRIHAERDGLVPKMTTEMAVTIS